MAWTMADAIETAKAAAEWSGEKSLTYRNYRRYRKKFGGPSVGFILNRFKWEEFKNKYLDVSKMTVHEKMNKKLEDNFCGHCKDKDSCKIKLENCDHWEYWKNQRNIG